MPIIFIHVHTVNMLTLFCIWWLYEKETSYYKYNIHTCKKWQNNGTVVKSEHRFFRKWLTKCVWFDCCRSLCELNEMDAQRIEVANLSNMRLLFEQAIYYINVLFLSQSSHTYSCMHTYSPYCFMNVKMSVCTFTCEQWMLHAVNNVNHYYMCTI